MTASAAVAAHRLRLPGATTATPASGRDAAATAAASAERIAAACRPRSSEEWRGRRTGALVAGAAGALLLLLMFLTWFHVESASFDIREASGVEGYSFEGLQTEYTYTGPYLDTLADEQDKDRDASAWDAFTGWAGS